MDDLDQHRLDVSVQPGSLRSTPQAWADHSLETAPNSAQNPYSLIGTTLGRRFQMKIRLIRHLYRELERAHHMDLSLR